MLYDKKSQKNYILLDIHITVSFFKIFSPLPLCLLKILSILQKIKIKKSQKFYNISKLICQLTHGLTTILDIIFLMMWYTKLRMLANFCCIYCINYKISKSTSFSRFSSTVHTTHCINNDNFDNFSYQMLNWQVSIKNWKCCVEIIKERKENVA